jgi:hypothetical protein
LTAVVLLVCGLVNAEIYHKKSDRVKKWASFS